jgi:hypothetical protein
MLWDHHRRVGKVHRVGNTQQRMERPTRIISIPLAIVLYVGLGEKGSMQVVVVSMVGSFFGALVGDDGR